MATLEQISKKAGDKIDALHKKLIKELAAFGVTAKDLESGDLFTFASKCSPDVRKQVEEACKQYHDSVEEVIEKSSALSYSTAIKNNIDGIAKKLPGEVTEQEYWRALTSNTYQRKRIESPYGLSLSNRVWNYTTQAKAEFEAAMSVAIEDGFEKGMSAENLGRNIRQYLNNPDAMWRRYHTKVQQADGTKKDVVEWRKRVIGPDGKVHFVKTPLDHPGRGVYRSARMNALRCSRTEINMGYREGDHSTWNNTPFVLGIEIELSNNHTCKGVAGIFRDICDDLAGNYPKTFKFTGWHPMCRCHATPLLPTSEQMADYLAAGSPDGYFDKYEIKDTPPQFNKWVKNNAKNIEDATKGLKSLPYFVRDNAKHTNEILGESIIKEPATKAAKVSIEKSQAKEYEKDERKRNAFNEYKARTYDEYKKLKSDENYKSVKYDFESGGLSAIHKEHTLDKNKGWYEKQTVDAIRKNGDVIVLESEKNKKIGEKYTEGTINGNLFEIAGCENPTNNNNIVKGLKHCASKKTAKIAVLFYPEKGFDKEQIDRALKRYQGIKMQKFERVICVQDGAVVFEK